MPKLQPNEVFQDLSFLVDYKHALDLKAWAYFFMRGCEAYQNEYARPVYRRVSTAHQWWEEGYDYIEQALKCRGEDFYLHDGSFCSAFLRGYIPDDIYHEVSGEIGLMARTNFENRFTRPTKVKAPEQGNDEMAKSPILYKVIDKNIYGTQIATDSQGRIVLETRGANSEIVAFLPAQLEEVVPYTVHCCGRAWLAAAGEFKENDIVARMDSQGNIGFYPITKINTKSRDASDELSKNILGIVQLMPPRAPESANAAEAAADPVDAAADTTE